MLNLTFKPRTFLTQIVKIDVSLARGEVGYKVQKPALYKEQWSKFSGFLTESGALKGKMVDRIANKIFDFFNIIKNFILIGIMN